MNMVIFAEEPHRYVKCSIVHHQSHLSRIAQFPHPALVSTTQVGLGQLFGSRCCNHRPFGAPISLTCYHRLLQGTELAIAIKSLDSRRQSLAESSCRHGIHPGPKWSKRLGKWIFFGRCVENDSYIIPLYSNKNVKIGCYKCIHYTQTYVYTSNFCWLGHLVWLS